MARGLRHLPLSAKQVARAKVLAKDARACTRLAAHPVAAVAAAIAYAVVFVDQVPLSAAEVAAPFRVGATRLRAAFEVLRAELDLTRGDARYATQPRRG